VDEHVFRFKVVQRLPARRVFGFQLVIKSAHQTRLGRRRRVEWVTVLGQQDRCGSPLLLQRADERLGSFDDLSAVAVPALQAHSHCAEEKWDVSECSETGTGNGFRLSVDFLTMAQADNQNPKHPILNLIDDAIISDADSPSWTASQFTTPCRSRVRLKSADGCNHSFLRLPI
jgi:hypothetical protein